MAVEPLQSRTAKSARALPDPLERVASLAPLLTASADEIRGAYVLYIGAGAVAVGSACERVTSSPIRS